MFKIAKERYFEEEKTNSTNTVVNITFISIVSVILAVVIFLSSFASMPGLMIAGIDDYVDKEFTEWNVNKANQTIIDAFSDIEKEVSKEIIKEINKKYITGYQGKVTSFWKNENKDTFQICNDDKNGQKICLLGIYIKITMVLVTQWLGYKIIIELTLPEISLIQYILCVLIQYGIKVII